MSNEPIADISRFHDLLFAVVEAGVPIDLLSQRSAAELREGLRSLENEIAVRVHAGMTVEEALHGVSASPLYRCALQQWLFGQDKTVALDLLADDALSRSRKGHALKLILLLPFVWAVVGFAGFLWICAVTVPMTSALVERMMIPPGPVLQVMIYLQAWIPVWLPGVPLAAVLFALFLRWRLKNRAGHQGLSQLRQVRAHRLSLLAYNAGQLIAAGAATEQIEDVLFEKDAETGLTNPRREVGKRTESSNSPSLLEPLLRWAYTGTNDTDGNGDRQCRLKFAAGMYRGLASAWSHTPEWPLVSKFVIVFGGLCALGIGLSVFLPLIEMLRFLATQEPLVQ